MAYANDIKDLEGFNYFPLEIAGLIGQYKDPITTGNDLRYLVKLDPTGRSARQALKDLTGLELKIEPVLAILDSKYDTLKRQRARYKDLIDLGLYHAALQMFKDDQYGRIAAKDYDKLDEDDRAGVDDKALVLTDKLFDLALLREDYKSLNDIVNIVSRGLKGHELRRKYDEMYPHGRNIGGKGLLWWLNNGNKKQIEYVVEHIPQYLYADQNKTDEPNEPSIIKEYDDIARKLYELKFDKQASKLVTFMHDKQMDTPFVLDKWFFSDEDGIDDFLEVFRKAVDEEDHHEFFGIIASDPQVKAKVTNILLENGIEQNIIDQYIR